MITQNGINLIKLIFGVKSKNKNMKNTLLSGIMLENFLQNEGLGHLLEIEGSIKYNEEMRFMYVSLPINCNNVCKRCLKKLEEMGVFLAQKRWDW